jgi:hypothetical protein
MVDIVVGVVTPLQNNQSRNGDRQPQEFEKKKAKERRKTRTDRRQSVRDGVWVTLSSRPERRQRSDRRKTGY